MGTFTDYGFHLPLLHKWEAVFNTRRGLPVDEDKPYVKIQQAFNSEHDIITIFAETGDNENRLNEDEAQCLQEFCSEARSLHALQFENPDPGKLVALLDDSDSNEQHRAHPGALTANALYRTLLIPRFHQPMRSPDLNWDSLPGLSPVRGEDFFEDHGPELMMNGTLSEAERASDAARDPDAERRLLYITNLDQWTVFALAATVSSHQVDMLRRFIFDHLAFKAGVDVRITTEGRRQFSLVFHLPIYALRNSGSRLPEQDPRSLRHIEDITFLRDSRLLEDEPGVGFDYLHQVELSCAVAGQDEHIWSAYLFADSYHEGWDKDDLEDYELQTAGLGQGFNIEDPLVGESLSKSPHKPREYFLKVLIVRSSQARSEWGRTIDHILLLVKKTRKTYYSKLSAESTVAADEDSGTEADGRSEKRRRRVFIGWIAGVHELIANLSTTLEGTIEAWRTFTAGDVRCFCAPDQTLNIALEDQRMLLKIVKNFEELADLLRRLERVKEDLNSISGQASQFSRM